MLIQVLETIQGSAIPLYHAANDAAGAGCLVRSRREKKHAKTGCLLICSIYCFRNEIRNLVSLTSLGNTICCSIALSVAIGN